MLFVQLNFMQIQIMPQVFEPKNGQNQGTQNLSEEVGYKKMPSAHRCCKLRDLELPGVQVDKEGV